MFLIALLSILAPPSLSSDPISEVFITVDKDYFRSNQVINKEKGTRLDLSCASSVIGSDEVDYKWYLSKVPFTVQTSQRVEISNSKEYSVSADKDHSGFYMCRITSREGYSVYTPVLEVIVEYFDILTEIDSVTIEPFEKVSVLSCSDIMAYPTPRVTWKKDGVDVNNINLDREVMHVTGKVVDTQYGIKVNDLVILNYKDTYAGTYTCDVQSTGSLITNRYATAKSFSVRTAASTHFMDDNSTKILFIDNGGDPTVGDAITLRCGSSGFPTPRYEWYDTNDVKLLTSDVYERKTKIRYQNEFVEVLETSMIVKSIKSSDDDAEYKCAAISDASRDVEAIRLTLADTVPKFEEELNNSEYNIPGATVTIDFGLQNRGSSQVELYWNGEGLAYFLAVAPGDSPRGSLVYEQEDNILKIEDIKISASGVFQCISYNEAGMVTQYKTVIIRESQPATVAHTTLQTEDITVIGNNIHSVRGAKFVMQCTGSGNPTPSDITIDVPDATAQIITSNLVKVNKEGKYIGNLMIDRVTESYAGDYTCCSHNFVNGEKEEDCITINLAVEERVRVTQNSEDGPHTLVIGNQVYGTVGYPLSASCKATGLPRPTLTIDRSVSCGTVSTITRSNDIEIIQVDYASDTCNRDTFECCATNTIQGVVHDDCFEPISVSFVVQQPPEEVKIENMVVLSSDDTSLVSLLDTLMLNCSTKSFPESSFSWGYRSESSPEYQDIDGVNFRTYTTKAKGFTYSVLSTIGSAADFFTGTNYVFQCTATNVFGETTVEKTIRITSGSESTVESSVYMGIGIILFIVALILIFIMYIFFIVSSGKKSKDDLGCMKCFVCKFCEPKELPVEYNDETYNNSVYNENKNYTLQKVDLYPDIKHMTFDEDEFDRSNAIVFNPGREFDDRVFNFNTAVFKDPDVV